MQKKVFEIIICLISLIGIILYGAFVGTFDNREKYLEFHPSTIIIPVSEIYNFSREQRSNF